MHYAQMSMTFKKDSSIIYTVELNNCLKKNILKISNSTQIFFSLFSIYRSVLFVWYGEILNIQKGNKKKKKETEARGT